MELHDFINKVRRGDFINAPTELKFIGRFLSNKEMKELFELVIKDDPYYHPYYNPYEKSDWEFNEEEQKKFKEYFINKIKEYYQSPDIILARKETKGGIAYSWEYSGKCRVLMMANKNVYELPPHIDEYSQSADKYFKHFYNDMRSSYDIQGRIHTLSECRRYEDYFVVEFPETFDCTAVNMDNKIIKQFIDDFQMKYKK